MVDSNSGVVLFFDGVCGLCSAAVDFVMARDRRAQFHFSPLQSDYAKTHLEPALYESLGTLVLRVDGQVLTKSDAVIKIAELLGGVWRIAILGRLFPRAVRDALYDFVARHRYRWFGKKETCRLPTPEERARFYL
ncbi:MAG: thiol-disulfide oxidoreductase DCC family protein [Bdellovibrionales bacterium]